MAVLSLPLTFTNSFWTQDYRKGLETLYKKLELVMTRLLFGTFNLTSLQCQGVVENDEIVAFIRVSIFTIQERI